MCLLLLLPLVLLLLLLLNFSNNYFSIATTCLAENIEIKRASKGGGSEVCISNRFGAAYRIKLKILRYHTDHVQQTKRKHEHITTITNTTATTISTTSGTTLLLLLLSLLLPPLL